MNSEAGKKEVSEGVLALSLLNIGIGIWKIATNIIHSSYFLWTVWAGKGKAAVDATDYIALTKNVVFNTIVTSIIWMCFLIFGIATLKLNENGRKGIIVTSILSLLILFIIPLVRYLFSYKQGIIVPDPLPVLHAVNVWFFTRSNIKELFR